MCDDNVPGDAETVVAARRVGAPEVVVARGHAELPAMLTPAPPPPSSTAAAAAAAHRPTSTRVGRVAAGQDEDWGNPGNENTGGDGKAVGSGAPVGGGASSGPGRDGADGSNGGSSPQSGDGGPGDDGDIEESAAGGDLPCAGGDG